MAVRLIAFLCLLFAAFPAMAQDARTETVRFPAGATGTTIDGRITGREYVEYKLGASAGQVMRVSLNSGNTATYFNVYAPGKGPGQDALATGDLTGPMMPDINRFEGVLPESGTYTISVYLYRSAARRGERSDYTLDISIDASGTATQLPSAAGDQPVGASSAERAGMGNFDANGTVPCARYAGQPTAACDFGVARGAGGEATVIVTHPDGFRRALFFIDGAFNSADTSQADGYPEYSATKESDLNLVRVGDERYEIPDAVVFGG